MAYYIPSPERVGDTSPVSLTKLRPCRRWKESAWGAQVCQWPPVRTSKACRPGHTLSSSLHNFKGKLPPLFFSFLDFFWLRRSYPSRFVSKPPLNSVSVIKCSQIRKRCRNVSVIGVSSLVNQQDLY